jgi:hypothetical protein
LNMVVKILLYINSIDLVDKYMAKNIESKFYLKKVTKMPGSLSGLCHILAIQEL